MAGRAYYSDSISAFLSRPADEVLGALTRASAFAIEPTQRDAWMRQVGILKAVLAPYSGRGTVYFEYAIPRLGRRIDVVAVIEHAVFVIEFKVGEREFTAAARDQVWDYGLDLKNFHESSHDKVVAPILVATEASAPDAALVRADRRNDGLLHPIRTNVSGLAAAIEAVLRETHGLDIRGEEWEAGRYSPTPTIVEAAMALYGGHDVAEISRSDAGAVNLSKTSATVAEIIRTSRELRRKSIVFVTGVPGAGKTLVGLDVATQHVDKTSELYSVFLSGNGALVAVMREALARDKVRREKEAGRKARKGEAMSEVKMFIQNVHHFRDDCLLDESKPPIEHVALFDEAQRAWNREQTSKFMLQKKGRSGFDVSEPEFLISCLDRHPDWATVVCLVGGGQEINTGEAGIGEWATALLRSFPEWHVHLSPQLHEPEYGAGEVLARLTEHRQVHLQTELHLAVSMRSFRAEHVSTFVKQLLDLDSSAARRTLAEFQERYPMVLSRNLKEAKTWMREMARGTERDGIVVSSEAQRLKPHAIDVRSPMDPVHWFLDGKEDVRSSYYLEDVATEFHVQGLELDWSCVVWDGDLRYSEGSWQHYSFVGAKWNRIRKAERQTYLKNAYRVLLTRARQGMALVIPEASPDDPTRSRDVYDATYEYLHGLGLKSL